MFDGTTVETEASVTTMKAKEATSSEIPAVVNATGPEEDKNEMLKAAKQVEIYFADANLPYDKFMWTLHTANPEHWVPVKTLASFKRMREFQPLGVEWLGQALRLSEELELDEKAENVRRRTQVREPVGQLERSIYVKGFPIEEPASQEGLEGFFGKYGKTNAVCMRRVEATNVFKGSVFVEFADEKSVDAFLNASPKPTWNGQELLVMTLAVYCDKKIKEEGLTGDAAIIRKQNIESMGRKGFSAFREMEKKRLDVGKVVELASKPNIQIEVMDEGEDESIPEGNDAHDREIIEQLFIAYARG